MLINIKTLNLKGLKMGITCKFLSCLCSMSLLLKKIVISLKVFQISFINYRSLVWNHRYTNYEDL